MKILLLHASAGAGHTKAAEALYNGLQKRGGHSVTILDSLDLAPGYFKHIYRSTYIVLVTKFPWLWGIFFSLTDLKMLRGLIRGIRRIQNGLNTVALVEYLKREDYDYIFSTHFLGNEVLGHLKEKGIIKAKIVGVITDYDVHSIWLSAGIDLYCCASEFTKERLIELGVPLEKIHLTGIPTDEKFAQPHDKPAIRKKLNIREDLFTVLVATGSFGMGPIEEVIGNLEDFQVLVVCGHNKDLFQRLKSRELKYVKVLGLVGNMDELMSVSDAMISKPGGLSISEALVMELPLVFFSAIPGQETNNVKVLKHYGIGISDRSASQMAVQLMKWRSSPEEFQSLKERIRQVAKPQAVPDIIQLIHD